MDDPTALAVALAKPFEGFSSVPYLCPARVWTIGWGSTRDLAGNPVTKDTPAITAAEGDTLALRDMRKAVQEVVADVRVALSPRAEAALADFVYNLGGGNFRSSTLLRDINAGRLDLARTEILKWDHASGVVLAGLLRRRQAEAAQL